MMSPRLRCICTPFTVDPRIYNHRGVATVTPEAIIPEDDYRCNSVVIYDHIVRRAQRQLVTRRLPQPPLTRRPGDEPTRSRHWKIITCCTGPAGPVPATRVHAYYNNIYFFVASKVALVHRTYTSYKYAIILCLMGIQVCIVLYAAGSVYMDN